MEKKELLPLIQALRQETPKRKFSQSIDLVINLKNIDLKKEDQRINLYVPLPHERGKKVRITALVGPELEAKAKRSCDQVIAETDFNKLDKKAIKKLAVSTDFFIAQANIMPRVAGVFGKILGPRGLMPSPKSGGIVAPTIELEPIVRHFRNLVRLETKNELAVKTRVGLETMPDEALADNAATIINTIIHTIPQERNNIKSIVLKMTMGAPIAFDTFGNRKEVKKTAPAEKPSLGEASQPVLEQSEEKPKTAKKPKTEAKKPAAKKGKKAE